MSIYGSQVLSDIETARSRARSQAHADESVVSQLRARHSAANSQLSTAYEKLMQVRTKDPSAKRRGLAEVDAWLLETAGQREKAYQTLLVHLTQATALASQLDAALKEHGIHKDEAQSAWDAARSSMHDILARDDPGFIEALQRTADAVRRSQAVDTHLEEISSTTKSFAAECEKDALFAYCQARRVGAPDSVGNFLTRGLDRWVASLADYHENRQLLVDAQQDLERWVKHQALLHAELVEARASVESAIDAALETETGRRLESALSGAIAQLDATKKSRKEAHAEVSLLSSQKEEFDSEQDPLSKKMRDRVFEAISRASDHALREAAKETTSAEDDEAAIAVADLRQQIPELSQQITRAAEKAETSAAQAKRLDSLASSFSSRGYNGSYSRFDYGFDTNSLITGVMMGRMSVNQAIGQCDSSHRDVTPPPPPPPSPSYSSGSSGGFSSGGGFGGGGGHSTGGGF